MSVVGIDLGTTNTVVACVRSGKVHVLADEHANRLLPSVVSFHPNGDVLVGAAAKARRIIDPRNTVYSHKRLIGRSWGSPEIAQAKSRFPFELKEGPGQGPLVRARGQDYTLPEISAFVLKRTRQIAEAALGGAVDRAVITVPAHFNELQRASTKVAGRVSGLEVLRILNEPTAAALAYGLGRSGNERVAVYDFGGGTFDCTLLDLNGNVFEVLATAGDSFLGGDDVDGLIADRMAEAYLKAHRYDPRTDAQMLERLRTTAEDMKMALSTAETHTVVLKEFGHGSGGSSINFTFTMTRRDLDPLVTPLIERSFKVTQDALSLARLSPTSFDKVILVGGSTRIPLIRKRVEAFFGAPPLDRVNPDEVVAIGAAIQAAALTEGARKRSIPAPPGVIGKPHTLPGVQGDRSETTQTGMLDTTKATPGPAFGSHPPNFGFPPASSPPPPPPRSAPAPKAPPPPRAPAPSATSHRMTSPGLAPPDTLPMGARGASAEAPGDSDDPSIASFPDLSAPAPFEWFPSSQPGAAPPAAQSGTTASVRGLGGKTVPTASADPATLTTARDAPATADASPGRGRPAGGFGAIDEPPSLMSSASASIPSFPSFTGSSSPAMPSPLGGPPGRGEPVPGGAFGEVRDLSLISTSGVSSPGVVNAPDDDAPFGSLRDLSLISTTGIRAPEVPGAAFGAIGDLSLISTTGLPTPGQGAAGFGHVSDDLSLVSTSSPTAELGADPGSAEARRVLLEGLAGEPQTKTRDGATVNLSPLPRPARGPGPATAGLEEDLPALAESTDLPSPGRRPEIRRPGQAGAAMTGKPPPKMPPQPFGPMEKVGDTGPHSRTAAMQARPPHPAPAAGVRPAAGPQGTPARPPAEPVRTAAMPARTGASTLQEGAPPVPPAPATRTPGAATPFGSGPPAPFGSVPPTPFAAGPAAPFGSAPPAPPPPRPPPSPAFAGQPGPPPASQFGAFAAASPAAQGFGSSPPPLASQPPSFGAYASMSPEAPLDVGAMSHAIETTARVPGAPPLPGGVGFQAPVLVDVTPRGLVVETAGGYCDTIIPRNSTIPCERTRRFATGRDMQTVVRVRVGQGESQLFGQSTYLGEVELSGLRPAPRGEVVVAVTFEVDADGALRIRARDVQSGQEARATLQLIGVADESSVVMMINRFAQQPVVGAEPPGG